MEKHLPKNWVECKLSDVFEIVTGNTPSKSFPEYYGGNIPWVKPGDINKSIEIYETQEFLSNLGFEKSRKIAKGSVMVTCIGNLGNIAIAGTELATNQQINSIVISHNLINKKYVYYRALTFKKWLVENSTSTTISMVNKSNFEKLPFLLPPLPEQNRIVEKLDKMFNQLETIKASMANIPLLLKDFRQQVLTQAITGKLTEAWRNEKNSKDWKITKVGKFMKEVKDKIDPTIIDELPYIGLEHIRKDGGIIAIGISSDLKSNKTVFKKNDVLYGKLRPYLNKHDVVKFDGICSTDILVYRNDNINSCIFFNYFLGNSAIIEKLNGEAKGINLPRVSASIVNNLDIKIPSPEEQKEIVFCVESLFDKANAIELEFKILKEKMDDLPQALLHKAFKGELTDQLKSDGDGKDLLKAIDELKKNTISKKKKV